MSEQEKQASGLTNLVAWQRGVAFAIRLYKEVIPFLPSEEKWAMATQLRRAASSIPANIAEGYGRHYFQEGIRFCYIARGSLAEVTTFLQIAIELGYMQSELGISLEKEATELLRLINGYVAYLKKNKPGRTEPGVNLQVREVQSEYWTSED
jgi:four helix bundle protein